MNNTTVVLTPLINSETSISYNKVSNDYLEKVSRDVIYTLLSLTPETVEYSQKAILTLANPDSYGQIRNQVESIKADIMSKKFSTAFFPVYFDVNTKTLEVYIDGFLSTYLAQKEVSRNKKQ